MKPVHHETVLIIPTFKRRDIYLAEGIPDPRKVKISNNVFLSHCQNMIGNDVAIVTFKQPMSGFGETCFEPVLPSSPFFYPTVECDRNYLVGMGHTRTGIIYDQRKKNQKLTANLPNR